MHDCVYDVCFDVFCCFGILNDNNNPKTVRGEKDSERVSVMACSCGYAALCTNCLSYCMPKIRPTVEAAIDSYSQRLPLNAYLPPCRHTPS